jgi:periplasmic divalent cation tolerance protein
MAKCILVYITCANKQEARRIGKKLVEERLAACVNILNGMESIYSWEGKINSAKECVLIAKTRATLTKKLMARVKSLHSYDCPCIVIFPITAGNPEFLKWIEMETVSHR